MAAFVSELANAPVMETQRLVPTNSSVVTAMIRTQPLECEVQFGCREIPHHD